MITKIKLKNIKIEDFCRANELEINLQEGLNIIPPQCGDFIAKFSKYILDRMYKKHRLQKLFKIDPFLDKNDLSYIEFYCTYKDKILKYSSTYADGDIFTETLMIDNELIGYRDYSDDSLETGKYWDILGEVMYNKSVQKIDARILCNTVGGSIIENTLKDYIICDTETPNISSDHIKSRLVYDDLDITDDLNNLLPGFGFDCRVDKDTQLVYHSDCKYGIPISLEGSGFNHLLHILPEVIYCMRKNKNLGIIIPHYGATLHFLVKKQLKNFLKETGLNIIATDWEENIEREKGG